MILVRRPPTLGGLLVGVPALRAIRRAHPDDEVVLAGPRWLEPLALHTGAVDRVEEAPGEADVVYDLRRPDDEDDEPERVRTCRVLEGRGIPADPDDLALDVPDVEVPWRADTIVHPGAAAPARQWPASRWAIVAEQQVADGHDVVVTGSEHEAELCWQVAGLAGLGKQRSLAGRTSLLQLAALVAGAGRVLSGDTGVAHLARAFGTPSVVVYGPTSPVVWGPPDGPHVALWRGRTGDPDAERPFGGLLAIEVDEVLDALDELRCRIRAA